MLSSRLITTTQTNLRIERTYIHIRSGGISYLTNANIYFKLGRIPKSVLQPAKRTCVTHFPFGQKALPPFRAAQYRCYSTKNPLNDKNVPEPNPKTDELKSDKPSENQIDYTGGLRAATKREINHGIEPIQAYEAETDDVRKLLFGQPKVPPKRIPKEWIDEQYMRLQSKRLRIAKVFYMVICLAAGVVVLTIVGDFENEIEDGIEYANLKREELARLLQSDESDNIYHRIFRFLLEGIDKLTLILTASPKYEAHNRHWYLTFNPEHLETVKLLPDPVPPPYGHPWTLVIDLDTLVASTYDSYRGWRSYRRPGVDFFLTYLAQQYEIVVAAPSYGALSGEVIVNRLDPNRALIPYRLYYWSLFAKKGVKQIEKLNRPAEKVIVIDVSTNRCNSPDNVIEIPKYNPDVVDKTLLDLVPLLQEIALQNPRDIRRVISNYSEKGKNILEEYTKLRAQAQAQKGKKGVLSGIVSK